MKSKILTALSYGTKTELDLAALAGIENIGAMLDTLEELERWSLIERHSRQINEGHNVIRWEYSYSLNEHPANAA